MAAKHYESLDYDKFELHLINRSVAKIKNLERSMRDVGWKDAYPMYCVGNGKKLKIKDGHNRFIAAKNIGIAVKYVIDKDNISMFQLQKATKPWSNYDYLEAYIKERKEAYIIVDDYMNKTGIPLGACIGLLGGELAASNNKMTAFRAGTYEVKNTELADNVGDIILYLKSIGIPWATNALLVNAIAKVLFIPQLDIAILKQKLKSNKSFIQKHPDTGSYVSMLEEIHNYRNQKNKMPLAFLADEEARKRKDKLFAK